MNLPVLASVLFLASLNVSAAEIHNLSRFVIDWDVPATLQQADGLGCPGVANFVTIQVPGTLNKDFTILGGSSECRLSLSMSATDERGELSTTLIYQGECASDNDENFTVVRSGSKQQAHITVDAGC